jgi:glycosyltransferase involved in cell wall biosynthesis
MIEPPVKPPIAAAPLSAILIAHEPRPDLEETLSAWKAVLDRRGGEYEILIVDDTGTPPPEAEIAVPEESHWRFLRHEVRRGLGASLRTGIAAARHPLLFYTTADRQYHPDDIQLLLDQIDHVDLVSGFRSWQPLPGSLAALGTVWRVFLRVVVGVKKERKACWLGWREERRQWLARLLFGLHLHDTNCAFRLLRREVLDRFPIQSDGALAQVEILAKANYFAWLSEVPVRYTPAQGEAARYWLEWYWADIWRLLSHPEFRPPVEQKPPATTEPVEASPPSGGEPTPLTTPHPSE